MTGRISTSGLGDLIEALACAGYQVIGPVVRDAAIVYGPVSSLDDLPKGWTSMQAPGRFSLETGAENAFFDYASSANSVKTFLRPSERKFVSIEKDRETFRFTPRADAVTPRFAFLGVRACDLASIAVQDKVLLEVDPDYRARRESALFIAVHCNRPSSCCFCVSMSTGPRATSGYDLALTEFPEGGFLIETGSERGAALLHKLPMEDATAEMIDRSQQLTDHAAASMQRSIDPAGVRESLRNNFDHPEWNAVAERCLACGNCTMVCPTCFCVEVGDSSDISGSLAERSMRWDSCFSLDFSYIHGGRIRVSTAARYRQWLTHKFSYWFDQFGTSGCVGCGRCIAWCPVGIDVTEEIARIGSTAGLAGRPGAPDGVDKC
jgi:ferredoxin